MLFERLEEGYLLKARVESLHFRASYVLEMLPPHEISEAIINVIFFVQLIKKGVLLEQVFEYVDCLFNDMGTECFHSNVLRVIRSIIAFEVFAPM